jgi:cysteinyl-tRNA synthetase, unknown class
MSKPFLLFGVFVCLSACQSDNSGDTTRDPVNYRAAMRDFVIGISQYSRNVHPGFIVIPQNGIELVTDSGTASGQPVDSYLSAIDGLGQEDLFYGYTGDEAATPGDDSQYLCELLDVARTQGKSILVTNYCKQEAHVNDAYAKSSARGYVSFAADERDLNHIPAYPDPLPGENITTVKSLAAAKNFLYLINPGNYESKEAFIADVGATNYDMLIMDAFDRDGVAFTAAETEMLRHKANGGSRLVIAYLSIGEAEDYRYYWNSAWNLHPPAWLLAENPDWPGDFKVKYWVKDWQDLIYGTNDSYMQRILDAGFDGVYLDIIDGFEYFEAH